METRNLGFSIEATSHCQDERWPRWSWWIRGIENSNRYGVVGTDERGHGLYLYSFGIDRTAQRQELLSPASFTMDAGINRQHANQRIVAALIQLGWGHPARTAAPASAPSPKAPPGFLRI